MQATAAISEHNIRLDEPVASLFKTKPNVVWSIQPDASVYEAIDMMSQRQIGALIVMSGNRLAGIISERDYARKVILRGKSSRDTAVREIMTVPVVYVTPQETIDDCMRVMTTRRVRHLPVLEGEDVVGMVSIGDVVNWIIMSQGHTIKQLHNYITGKYPA